jgi:HAD superfamily hydrolase (TIGR01509 family)
MEKIKHSIKAIIFDMDGTIIHTEKVWEDVTLEILASNGVHHFSNDDKIFLESLVGMNLHVSSEVLKKRFGLTKAINELVLETVIKANQKIGNQIQFIDGFEQFHAKLQVIAMPTGVATNADPLNLKHIAEQMEFKKFFGDNLYTPTHVNNKPKPDPAIFLYTAKQLGALPHECIVFEDSWYGFQAAQAAGMKCIAIKNDTNKHLLAYVQESIETYHEAEAAIKKIS